MSAPTSTMLRSESPRARFRSDSTRSRSSAARGSSRKLRTSVLRRPTDPNSAFPSSKKWVGAIIDACSASSSAQVSISKRGAARLIVSAQLGREPKTPNDVLRKRFCRAKTRREF